MNHSNDDLQIRLRVVRGADVVMGPGRADLLAQIQATGSIAAAGRQMKMSYKRAWALVESMNTTFARPVIEAAKGGTGGGGARLTPAGQAVLDSYRALQAATRAVGEAPLAALRDALQVPPR